MVKNIVYYNNTCILVGICPVLCSGHGQYGGGLCHCEEGWKGPECDVPESDCRVADCSGHGQCVRGSCRCKPGWKGEACEEPDCEDTTCSDHGACVQGQCYCKAGWKGDRCSVIDEQVHKCLPSCSDHGVYDLEAAKCICNRHWTGPDCSHRKHFFKIVVLNFMIVFYFCSALQLRLRPSW